jgi:low temperature requirement protein LtrA
VIGAFVLAMVLISGLWWVNFTTGDDARGLAEVEHTPADRRSGIVYRAYFPAHLLNIAGLVLVAAGLHEGVNAPTQQLPRRLAVTLPAGVAIFLLGRSVYRAALGLGRAWPHLVADGAVLLTTPVGLFGPAVLQLVCVTAVIVALEVVLSRDSARLGHGPAPT